jgi:hypothetical protein
VWAVVAVARAVMVNDVVGGHVLLDIECLDRLYLSGYVPGLPTPGGQGSGKVRSAPHDRL